MMTKYLLVFLILLGIGSASGMSGARRIAALAKSTYIRPSLPFGYLTIDYKAIITGFNSNKFEKLKFRSIREINQEIVNLKWKNLITSLAASYSSELLKQQTVDQTIKVEHIYE